MGKRKQFDCVEMKDAIQRKLLKEWEGLNDEQVREQILRHLETAPGPMAQLWRSIRSRAATAPSSQAAASGRR